jgi:hypothetical protein
MVSGLSLCPKTPNFPGEVSEDTRENLRSSCLIGRQRKFREEKMNFFARFFKRKKNMADPWAPSFIKDAGSTPPLLKRLFEDTSSTPPDRILQEDRIFQEAFRRVGMADPPSSPDIQHFLDLYKREITQQIDDPGMPVPMRLALKNLLDPGWIQTLNSGLIEIAQLADTDSKSHSKQYTPPCTTAPFVSVSIWPNTTAKNLAERFQDEIGLPYYQAQIQYANKYSAYGGSGFAHLFFYYCSSSMGVAIAFLPYSDDTVNYAIILPDSIQKQTETYLP